MCTVFNLFVIFLYDSQLFIFMISSICVGLPFYFSVVISNSFNLIFETDLLRNSINYSFLKIMLSASPVLHQALPVISVITQINARLRLTV